jgi:transcription-repair coupling factor (superfamily II helicase)
MWTDEDGKHIIIADDILGQIFVKKRTKKSIAKHLDLLLTLKPGDYIVHREHGIALFHSVVKKTLGEIEREYLELHYAEGDKLFVPLTEIYRVSRYIGDNHPELTRLSGAEWERTMEKTNEEIEAIAQDILETSAKRTLAKGRAFGVFREEELRFQEAFAYTYTLDQKSAIDEIFADMESESPMDRLISGDVGFGKTEVAMNAIYKAVLSGTQVAVLSPLLVLADEHYETFCTRLAPFGVRV